MSEKKSFGWGHLVVGILFILSSLFAFSKPTNSLVGLTLFLGMVAIIKGIFDLINRKAIKDLTGYRSTMLIIVAIIDILLGILLVTNIGASLVALPIIFAIWFIIDSIQNLCMSSLTRPFSNGFYWFTIIVNVLGVIVGFMLLANPLSSALTLSFLVGFYLMWFGILNVIWAFIKE